MLSSNTEFYLLSSGKAGILAVPDHSGGHEKDNAFPRTG